MGFVDDLWTALLSDEEVEAQDALDRLGEDDAVAKAAAATLWADEAAFDRRNPLQGLGGPTWIADDTDVLQPRDPL